MQDARRVMHFEQKVRHVNATCALLSSISLNFDGFTYCGLLCHHRCTSWRARKRAWRRRIS
jgi:hypothetical protein